MGQRFIALGVLSTVACREPPPAAVADAAPPPIVIDATASSAPASLGPELRVIDAGRRDPDAALLREAAGGIRRRSSTRFDVTARAREILLSKDAHMHDQCRFVPEREGDKQLGIRFFGVRSESALGLLGIENGDRVSAVDGIALDSLANADRALETLRAAASATVRIERRGKPMVLEYSAVP